MANVPIYNLTDTWNAGGTTFDAIKMAVTDTASSSGSRLLDLLVDSGGGAASKFRVDKAGNVTAAGTLGVGGSDCILLREAANELAMRNAANAQNFRIYNTYTDASNYERGFLRWDTNVLKLGTAKAGSGVARALELQTDGTTRITVGTTVATGVAITTNVGVGGYFPSAHTSTTYRALWLGESNVGLMADPGSNFKALFLTANCMRTSAEQFAQQDTTRNSFLLTLGYEASNNGLSLVRAAAGAGDTFTELFAVRENYGYFSPSVGIGTTAPGRKLDVNDSSGNCLRLTYNDSNGSAANYADFLVSSSGDLTITPSGGDVAITGAVETAAPTGGTAAKWKLGTVASVSPTSPDRTIEVEIGGTTYYLAAKTTND